MTEYMGMVLGRIYTFKVTKLLLGASGEAAVGLSAFGCLLEGITPRWSTLCPGMVAVASIFLDELVLGRFSSIDLASYVQYSRHPPHNAATPIGTRRTAPEQPPKQPSPLYPHGCAE